MNALEAKRDIQKLEILNRVGKADALTSQIHNFLDTRETNLLDSRDNESDSERARR